MNINNATQANVSQINNKAQKPKDTVNNNFQAPKTKAAANDDKVSLSDAGRVNSHLQSLPPKHQAEIKSFVNNLNKQAGSAIAQNNQIKHAPETVKNMAEKLNMEIKDIASAMPTENANKPRKMNSTGVAAYNAVASQPQAVTTSSLLASNATKASVAKTAIA